MGIVSHATFLDRTLREMDLDRGSVTNLVGRYYEGSLQWPMLDHPVYLGLKDQRDFRR